jgi:LmbE family N-acetylglucosaminyl deacetylase
VRVLVVAAHPDDELLGCGGTIAWHATRGDLVDVLIMATGATSRDDPAALAYVEALQASARRAAGILGAREPRFLGLPDNRLDSLDLLDVVKRLENVLAETRPEVVYTHFDGDLNVDHEITARAVLTAARPFPSAVTRAIYAFETLSSTEWRPSGAIAGFRPARFVDIGPFLERKIEALACYAGEMRDFPHPRSPEAVRALATLRGAAAGLAAAEAFMVLREMVA